jgi:serine/threonine protein kinase
MDPQIKISHLNVLLIPDQRLKIWVSIKVKTAESSKVSGEIEILRALRESAASTYIVKLIDDFVHQGPNGEHQCLVFELLGPTIDSVLADYAEVEDHFDTEISLKIPTQLLQGIASIHAAGYVHGGLIKHAA